MTNPFAAPVIYKQQVASTMQEARELTESRPPTGTTVWAQSQTHGRGRVPGRVWRDTPDGSLLATIILECADVPAGPSPSLIVCAAVISMLDTLHVQSKLEVKWPNDIMLNNRKTAGILCEMVGSRYLLAGIGVNVFAAPQSGSLRRPATCLADNLRASSPKLNLEMLLQILLAHLQTTLMQPGSEIIATVERRLLHRGKTVQLNDVRGVLSGLGSHGEVLIDSTDGLTAGHAGELILIE